jgi:NDP-sugar pyrophosphorylase family protein
VRALILTAGLGTRLRPLTFVRAKAAVPVNGEPIVRRVIAWLTAQGINDLVLNLHHRPASITALVGDGRDLGARVRYSWENPVLGSAGGPRHALPLLVDSQSTGNGQESACLLVNGDTMTDLAVDGLVATHRSSGATVTMALIPNPKPELYGGVVVEDGRVVGFSRRGSATPSFHFIGIQIAEARVFSTLDDGVPAETVMQLYPQLIRENRTAIVAHIVDAHFRDVGTPAEYLQSSLELAGIEGDCLVSATDVNIDPSAAILRTAVWDHVRIGADALLEECIVCDGVRLPGGARYARCAIAPYDGQELRGNERVEGHLVISPF